MENDLSNEDHGNDYISVEALIKKQDDLDAEIASRAASVQQCIDKAREFEKQVSSILFFFFPMNGFRKNSNHLGFDIFRVNLQCN